MARRGGDGASLRVAPASRARRQTPRPHTPRGWPLRSARWGPPSVRPRRAGQVAREGRSGSAGRGRLRAASGRGRPGGGAAARGARAGAAREPGVEGPGAQVGTERTDVRPPSRPTRPGAQSLAPEVWRGAAAPAPPGLARLGLRLRLGLAGPGRAERTAGCGDAGRPRRWGEAGQPRAQKDPRARGPARWPRSAQTASGTGTSATVS